MEKPWHRTRCSTSYCLRVARTSHPLFICEECKKLQFKPNIASCQEHVYHNLYVCKHFNNRIIYKDFTNYRLPNISLGSHMYPKDYFNYYPTIELSSWIHLQTICEHTVLYTCGYSRRNIPTGHIYTDHGFVGYSSIRVYLLCVYSADVLELSQGKLFFARKAGGTYLNLLPQELFVIIRLYLLTSN
jgi:hypothetical protein